MMSEPEAGRRPAWMETYLAETFSRWLEESGRKGGASALPPAALTEAQVAQLQALEQEWSAAQGVAIVLVAYQREAAP